MADTSNEIIQTLEAIHNDIKAAKDTLKENNVALDSNATSTLSTEINKIPTAIKESDTLIGFNNGAMSMSGGFLYKTNEYSLSPETATVMKTEDGVYTIPEGKSLNMPFINKIPYATNLPKNNDYTLKYNGYSYYEDLFKHLYEDYMINNCLVNNHNNITSGNKLKYLYIKSIETNVYEEDTKTLNTSTFVMPGIVPKIFFNEKEVNRVKCGTFVLSFNYNIPEVECGSLELNLDTIPTLANLFPSQSENGGGFGDDSANYIARLEQNEPYLKIIMKDIDFVYRSLTLPSSQNAISLHSREGVRCSGDPQRSKIGIYVDDTKEENLKKLDDVYVLLSVLRFFTVYNLDGSKCYSAKTKKFIPKEEYMSDNYPIDYNNLDLSPYHSYDEFLAYNRNMIYTDNIGENRTIKFKREVYDTEKFNFDDKLNRYYMTDSGLETSQLDKGSNALLLNPNAEKYDIYIFNYYPNIISLALGKLSKSDYTFKFSAEDNLLTRGSNAVTTMPFLSSCLLIGPYNTMGYGVFTTLGSGNKILFTNAYVTSHGPEDVMTLLNSTDHNKIGLLLAAPYDTKFIPYAGNPETDYAVAAELDECPLVYNKYIKSITLTENSKAYITTQWFNKPYLLSYRWNSTLNKVFAADIPSEPMKFIFHKTTKLSGIENMFALGIDTQVALGPYTTDESAKYWDKFINILVPEDYPDLGTYAFNKYRLPVYNLDKTKKYNYSKKAWEPITALTDDSTPTNDLFTEEEKVNDLGIRSVQTLTVEDEYLNYH